MFELTQKEMVAYIIYSSKKIDKFSDKTLENYIEILQQDLINTNIGQVLCKIDLRLFNNFEFKAKLNHSEIIVYAKLIYKRLLNYFDKKFTDEDIIKESIFIFKEYSVRTAMEAVYGLLGVDRGVPEVWGSVYDVRDLLDSSVKLIYKQMSKVQIFKNIKYF